jgi:predicted DNA-binding protein (MmcQ/YjbR family)
LSTVARAPAKKADAYRTALRKFGLAFPEAHEEFPWGELALKVRKKIFVTMYVHPETHAFHMGVKLPHSHKSALAFPFTEPMGYGLGKNGWVTSIITSDHDVPVDLLKEWITESYRTVAPKTLVALLDEQG